MDIEHVFLYEPMPAYPLAMAHLPRSNGPWEVVRTEVSGHGYDLETGEPKVQFTHFIKPKEE